jgi:hypothetical protein
MTDFRTRAVLTLRKLADRLEHRTITLEGFRRDPRPGKYWLHCDEVSLHRYTKETLRLAHRNTGMNGPAKNLGEEVERRRDIKEDAEGFVHFRDLPGGYYQAAGWQDGELVYVFEPMKIREPSDYYSVGPFPIEMTVTR